MKKILFIFIIISSILLTKNSFSKIININNTVTLLVPDNFIYIKGGEDGSEFVKEIIDIIGENSENYLIGTKDSVDVALEYQNDPDTLMEPIIEKMETKNFSSESSMMKFVAKEVKKLFKDLNYEGVIWLVIGNDDLEEIDIEFYQLTQEITKMNKNQLKKENSKYQKKWKSFIRDAVGELNKFMKVSKLKIANNKQIPSMEFSINYNMKGFKGSAQFYSFIKNKKPIILVYECVASCPKNFKSLDKMLSPTFSNIISNRSSKDSSSSIVDKKDNPSSIVDDLKKLNDLYKSGVLSKDEFEKAKKKILN